MASTDEHPEGDLFGSAADSPASSPMGEGGLGSASGRELELDDARPATLPPVRDSFGRQSNFDDARLRASIEKAQRAAGEKVTTLADEVADIVRFTLMSGGGVDPRGMAVSVGALSADAIGDLVERALIEVGATKTARNYIVARDRKLRARQHGYGGDGPAEEAVPETEIKGASREWLGAGPGKLPQVRGAAGAEAFQKRRIVGALIEEAGLLPREAEEVASGVESNLYGAGLRVVSTGLVRELVSSQLLARGFGEALKRHESVGVPRHDLTQMFERSTSESVDPRGRTPGVEGSPVAPGSGAQRAESPAAGVALGAHSIRHGSNRFEEALQESVLSRWVLEDVLGPETAERHRTGDIYLADLSLLHRVRVRSLPAHLLLRGAEGVKGGVPRPKAALPSSPAFACLGRIGRLARDVSRGLLLEDIGAYHQALDATAHGEATDRAVAEFVLALGAVGQASGRSVDLVAEGSGSKAGGRGSRAGGASAAAVRSFTVALAAALQKGASVPRLFASLDAIEGAAALGKDAGDAAEFLLWSGHLVPVWSRAGSHWAGAPRKDAERGAVAIGCTVALNLPRLARRAGPWREEAFFEGAMGSLEVAVAALMEAAAFQARARSVHGTAVSDRLTHTILPVGLFDALRILGDGLARADQGARLMGFLSEAAGRMASAAGLDLYLGAGCTTDASRDAAARFAAMDSSMSSPDQPRLFADLPRPEADRPSAYQPCAGDLTARTDPGRVWQRAEALGSLLSTVPGGALTPADFRAADGTADGISMRGALDLMESFARAPEPVLGAEAPEERADSSQFGPENPPGEAGSWLSMNRARWPRLAAWGRFAEIRGAAPQSGAQLGETTLF